MAETSGVVPPRTDLSGGSQRLVLVALVLGLVLGAGMVGLSWFVNGRAVNLTPMPVSQASMDAAAACAALARVPALESPEGVAAAGPGAQVDLMRLSGAASLASAAGSADTQYRSLSSALNEAAQVIVRRVDAHGTHPDAALAAARAACVRH